MAIATTAATVRKQISVRADLERAFGVFTDGFDTWWPRSHHLGRKPLDRAVIEPREGGRCYGREADGTEYQWGTVTAWQPPHRLVIAWQIDPTWTFEPDLSRASEVEVLFTAMPDGSTRVDLEHRHFERHGADADKVRMPVSGPGGWSGLLQQFARTAHRYQPDVRPLAFILATNDSLVERTLQGVPEADLWKRPTPQNNPLLWILGHIVHTRIGLLALLGETVDPGWGDVFRRGAVLQAEGYPTRERIKEVAADVNARLYGVLAALTAGDVAAAASRAFTPAVRTLGDQLAFLTMHDTYHVGQLAYVRKALGLPGVVG